MMYKVKIHSAVDLITNSSTVIYTNSDGCLEPFKLVVDEFLNIFNIELTCDDVFDVAILPDIDPIMDYIEYDIDDNELYNDVKQINGEEEKREYIENQLLQYVMGRIKKPTWYDDIKGYFEDKGSRIVIEPKEPQYEKLAEYFIDLIYSSKEQEYAN